MNKTMMFLGMLAVGFASAQQNDPYEGKVGVNTQTPSATLNVKSLGNTDKTKNLELENSTGTKMVTVLDNGYIGINNEAPKYILDIQATDDKYSSNSIALRAFRGEGASSIDIFKARGTSKSPLALQTGDLLGVYESLGYTGTKYKLATNITSIVTGDVTEDKVPSSLYFNVYSKYNGTGSLLEPEMVLHSNGNLGIGTKKREPSQRLEVMGNILSNTGGLLSHIDSNEGGYLELKNDRKIASGEATKWRIYNTYGTDSGYGNALRFWAYGTSSTGENENLGSKMVLSDEGNLGVGEFRFAKLPTEKLHIETGKVRIAELPKTAGASTDKMVVVDADGVLKSVDRGTSTGSAGGPIKVGSTTSMTCNDENLGTISFGDITVNGNTRKAFGFCTKDANGVLMWAYMVAGNHMFSSSNPEFGKGLN